MLSDSEAVAKIRSEDLAAVLRSALEHLPAEELRQVADLLGLSSQKEGQQDANTDATEKSKPGFEGHQNAFELELYGEKALSFDEYKQFQESFLRSLWKVTLEFDSPNRPADLRIHFYDGDNFKVMITPAPDGGWTDLHRDSRTFARDIFLKSITSEEHYQSYLSDFATHQRGQAFEKQIEASRRIDAGMRKRQEHSVSETYEYYHGHSL